jgi:hypothetical protein
MQEIVQVSSFVRRQRFSAGRRKQQAGGLCHQTRVQIDLAFAYL